MNDPFRQLLRWYDRPQARAQSGGEHELIEYRDRVTLAASLIRDHELRVWFEQDWGTALQISRLRPECTVFSVDPGALLVDRLGSQPPWRRGTSV